MLTYIRRKLQRYKTEKKPVTQSAIMSSIRHECHRVEKSVYNDILESKQEIFVKKIQKAANLMGQLDDKEREDPSMIWAKDIIRVFPKVESSFVNNQKKPIYNFDDTLPLSFLKVMQARRSNRVWAKEQPLDDFYKEIAIKLINAAITAPASGNRQGTRFLILTKDEDKILLKGIKEKHCYSAPLLIFVGADKDVYYSLGESDRNCRYLDAAASIMQMINIATAMNLGTCWNHFDSYMVKSRKKNIDIYKKFSNKLGLTANIEPIAILAVGIPDFVAPTPIRMNIDNFILNR